MSTALHVSVVALKTPNTSFSHEHCMQKVEEICQYNGNYSINQLLYGIEDSTLQENKTLFMEVQQCLTSCGRFNNVGSPLKELINSRIISL